MLPVEVELLPVELPVEVELVVPPVEPLVVDEVAEPPKDEEPVEVELVVPPEVELVEVELVEPVEVELVEPVEVELVVPPEVELVVPPEVELVEVEPVEVELVEPPEVELVELEELPCPGWPHPRAWWCDFLLHQPEWPVAEAGMAVVSMSPDAASAKAIFFMSCPCVTHLARDGPILAETEQDSCQTGVMLAKRGD